jgi:hypothetical protein
MINIKNSLKISVQSLLMASLIVSITAVAAIPAVSFAQFQGATMPALYDQNGTQANVGNGYLIAGYYYLGNSPTSGGHQIYYYGNGTYYDGTIGQYGGSVNDQNGTAGVALNYGTSPSYGFTMAMMPRLFNQSGVEVNGGLGYLNAGNYYLTNSAQAGGQTVEYYGNGTYYNPSTGQYGGSVNNSNGTAGNSLGYSV